MPLFALFFGAILGSFLNALTFRYNTGVGLWRSMRGRSHCMRCGHTLHAFDLVPILSYIFLRGRCRYCHAPISLQYPLVEIVAALLSLGVYVQFPEPIAYSFWIFVWMVILFLVVYDWRHLILPLEGLLVLIVLGFSSLFFSCNTECSLTMPTLLQLFSGPLLAAPLLFLSLISRGRWMGWGDGMLALPLGWMLGLLPGLGAFILAFWIGAVVGIGLLVFSMLANIGRVSIKTAIPFGPFLALGAAIIFFTHFDLFQMLGIY